jgi:hypothetical protein
MAAVIYAVLFYASLGALRFSVCLNFVLKVFPHSDLWFCYNFLLSSEDKK